jgi:hypothetical protein
VDKEISINSALAKKTACQIRLKPIFMSNFIHGLKAVAIKAPSNRKAKATDNHDDFA